ncbi:peptidase family M48 [Cedratvirus kamchatka]|uniref:Peptidase family M48 n=1 Tax=Cedratvirus kamchatka TaxID=2716914 RepID=A0A6G8MZ56_9VIRU|nr:peptidase family M48 [Cedratvirus kamchatka]
MAVIVRLSNKEVLACSFFLLDDYYVVLGNLVSSFSKEQVAWIIAHELGHMQHSLCCCPYLDKNSTSKVCVHLLLVFILVCYLCPLLLPMLCLCFYYIIYRWQRREYQADYFASLVMGSKIGISVLCKLQSMDGHGSSLTHPSYSSRISNIVLKNKIR